MNRCPSSGALMETKRGEGENIKFHEPRIQMDRISQHYFFGSTFANSFVDVGTIFQSSNGGKPPKFIEKENNPSSLRKKTTQVH